MKTKRTTIKPLLAIIPALLLALILQPAAALAESNRIVLKVEGDAANPESQIMLSAGGGGFVSLSSWSTTPECIVSDYDDYTTYEFGASITELKVYIKLDADTTYYGPLSVDADNPTTLGLGETQIRLDKVRYTVTWAYDASRYGEEALLQDGTAQIIAVDGVAVDPDTWWDSSANNPGNADGGHLAVTPGSIVTVLLKPDYGCQLLSVSLDGNTLVPQTDVSTFTFVMPTGNVHFTGAFTIGSETADCDSSVVLLTSLRGGNNAIDSGNLAISVTDSAADTSAAEALVDRAVSAQAIDISLTQVVNKGNGESWTTELTDLASPVTLGMEIIDYDSDYDYVVVREHNGELTKIASEVVDGTLSFSTDKFSTYTIVKAEKASPDTTPNTTPGSNSATKAVPKTADTLPVAGGVVLLAGAIVAGAAFARKRCR